MHSKLCMTSTFRVRRFSAFHISWIIGIVLVRSLPLRCPEGFGHPWKDFLVDVNRGWEAVQDGDVGNAKIILADALTHVTTDLHAAHNCSMGISAAYRVLALAHVVDPALSGRAKRRGLQVALRFMHLASNWLTHIFSECKHDVEFIDTSAWPLTLQESADEHRVVMKLLAETGPEGHKPHHVHVPHDYRHPSLSIAIVSLCAYPPGHMLPKYAMSNHRIYAERHGYEYIVRTQREDMGRPHAWGKVQLMKRYVEKRRWDWVIWADCDCYFMNLSVTLDSLLFRYGALKGKKDVSRVEQMELDPDFHFLVTEDHAMLNTGIFFTRSSSWSEATLQRIWGEHDSVWISHPWWEQAAFSWDFWGNLARRFRDENHAVWASQASQDSDDMSFIYPKEVRVAPQGEFNSYHPVTSRFLADTWSPGKFVLAFNGVLSSTSPSVVQELYGSYYEDFCLLNQVPPPRCLAVGTVLPWLAQTASSYIDGSG